MEQGFDEWVRSRLQPDSSDMQHIASHIDLNCFPEWTPSTVDDLFTWLSEPDQDTAMETPSVGDAVVTQLPEGLRDPTTHAASSSGQLPAVPGWQLQADQQQATVQQPALHPQAAQVAPLEVSQQHLSLLYMQQKSQSDPLPAVGMQPTASPTMQESTGCLLAPGANQAEASICTKLQQQQQQQFPEQLQPFGSTCGVSNQYEVALQAWLQSEQNLQQHQQPQLLHFNACSSNGSRGSGRSKHSTNSSTGHPSAGCMKAPGRQAPTSSTKKSRKVTEAQRAAHKRFRLRRKEQMSSLSDEVAAKQAQLQALQAEQEGLKAKARALDHLVACAGDSMMILQRLDSLTLGPNQQQQQQQQPLPSSSDQAHVNQVPMGHEPCGLATSSSAHSCLTAPALHSTSELGSPQPSRSLSSAAAAAAAATAVICGEGGTSGAAETFASHLPVETATADKSADTALDSNSTLRALNDSDSNRASGSGSGSRSGSGIPSPDNLTEAMGAQVASGGAAGEADSLVSCGEPSAIAMNAAAFPCGSDGSNGSSMQSTPSSAALSVERLESVIRAALGQTGPQPLTSLEHKLHPGLRHRLQSPEQQEGQGLRSYTAQGSSNSSSSLDDTTLQLQSTLPALQRLANSLVSEVMQLVLQLNKAREAGGAAAAAAAAAAAGCCGSAGGAGGTLAVSAAERLGRIRRMVHDEFRVFAYTNRIDTYLLFSLNLETGMLVEPPPGHWVSGAKLLLQRLDAEALQDLVVAHKLFLIAFNKVSQQRRSLLLQLQTALLATTASVDRRHTHDCAYLDVSLGACAQSAQLLNAIDSNLRKEYVLEGVFCWTFEKLLPPLLAAELMVTSYPYLTDEHAIIGELLHLLPPNFDPLSLPQPHNQHSPDMWQQQQQEQSQQQQLLAPQPWQLQVTPTVMGVENLQHWHPIAQTAASATVYSQQPLHIEYPLQQLAGWDTSRQVLTGTSLPARDLQLCSGMPYLTTPCG